MRQSRAQALIAATAIVIAAAVAVAALQNRRKQRRPQRIFDYSERSGFPRPAAEMRGTAAKKERASGPPSFETSVRV
jgi:hypothetical protein